MEKKGGRKREREVGKREREIKSGLKGKREAGRDNERETEKRNNEL